MYEAKQKKASTSRTLSFVKRDKAQKDVRYNSNGENNKHYFIMTQECNNIIQMKQDMGYNLAVALRVLRIICEEILWGKEKNEEVQLAIDDQKRLNISFNYGKGLYYDKDINEVDLYNRIKENFKNEIIKTGVPINIIEWDVDDSKTTSPGGPYYINKINIIRQTKSDKVFDATKYVNHAELRILFNVAIEILQGKKTSEEIYLRGKKRPCHSCLKVIQKIEESDILNKKIIIHRPTADVFNNTVKSIHMKDQNSDNEVSLRSQTSPNWHNPFSFFDTIENIKSNLYISDDVHNEFINELIEIGKLR